MNEAMLWCAWFTIIGFFQLFTQLCCDRFQYLCYSPSTTNVQHGKVVSLVGGIIFSCCALTGLSLYVGQQKDIHVFFFLFCEISLLSLKVLHLATKYTIYLLDLKSNSTWQNQKTVTYYSDIGFDVTILVVDIIYHVYMLIYSNIFLSMASLVLCMQLRSLFHDIKHRLAKHRKIIRVRKIVEQRFENASAELLEESSDNKCAICWEKMQRAKKLNCGHLFHSDCLCSWLVHDSSCPTCRHSLEEEMKDPSQQGDRLPRRTLLRNHFFHFDGRQIASWFPSFSVEVLHTRMAADTTQIPESRIDTMAHEVQAIFPNIPIQVIRADLTRTHSVDITTDNILEGNIHIPAAVAWQESTGNEPALQALPGASQNVSEEHELPPEPTNHEREERQPTVEERDVEETGTSAVQRTRANERGTFGVDFAEQTDQRQSSLIDRKKQMLQNARKRFLEKK
ncbi:E3 ubiquitin- ligase AMFR [Paramuricea clavata]|uniref:E3 ubiquitin- ligase AMFR n=1 Tax=Paramuricea clavata TaxID=317549 RepID=A0A6S7J703_PARCT|nr:E3 ubiquitin- ligase AMFR [Paramuricea clavata]